MAAATPFIAVAAKLKATTAVTNLVSTRVFPQLTTQEPTFPMLVMSILGAEVGATLGSGSNSLMRYTARIDCYAETELAAGALGKVVRETLSPWSDTANGVQGCFHIDTSAEYTEDGVRFQSETFDLWHTPT